MGNVERRLTALEAAAEPRRKPEIWIKWDDDVDQWKRSPDGVTCAAAALPGGATRLTVHYDERPACADAEGEA